VKKSLRLSCILSVLTLCNLADAASIKVLAAKTIQCQALQPLLADLNTLHFPSDWTVYVACDVSTWQTILVRSDNLGKTGAAFTDRTRKFTIINGMMYAPMFPFQPYTQKTPQRVLKHELGHITCDSGSEDVADRYADKGVCR
jgi:hypothetical protein